MDAQQAAAVSGAQGCDGERGRGCPGRRRRSQAESWEEGPALTQAWETVSSEQEPMVLVSVRLLTPRARMLAGTPTAAAMAAMAASLTVTGSGAEDGGGDGGPVVKLLAEPVTLMVMFMVVMAQPSKSLLHPGQGSGSAAGLEQECWLVGTRLFP